MLYIYICTMSPCYPHFSKNPWLRGFFRSSQVEDCELLMMDTGKMTSTEHGPLWIIGLSAGGGFSIGYSHMIYIYIYN